MNALLRAIVPIVSVLLSITVAALPWQDVLAHLDVASRVQSDLSLRLPSALFDADTTAMTLALLPIAAVYFWSFTQPPLMPAVVVFGIGLVLDVMMRGPLGIWPVAALLAALIGRRRRRLASGSLGGAAHLIVAMVSAAASVGILTSIFNGRIVPLQPLAFAASFAVLLYVPIAGLMTLLDRLALPAAPRAHFLRGREERV